MPTDFTPKRNLDLKRYSTVQKIQTSDDATNRMQYVQEKFVNDNSTQQTNQANTLSDISIGTSPTSVNHKLGRAYTGFSVIKNSTGANVYQVNESSNENKDSIIFLQASSATVVTILVF